MTKTANVVSAVIGVALITFLTDFVVTQSHEFRNGPYRFETARLEHFGASCQLTTSGYAANAHAVVELHGERLESWTPFIGLYPMRACLRRTWVPLYDYGYLTSLERGQEISVLVDRDGNVYLGRTNDLFNVMAICLLTVALVLALRWRRTLPRDEEVSA